MPSAMYMLSWLLLCSATAADKFEGTEGTQYDGQEEEGSPDVTGAGFGEKGIFIEFSSDVLEPDSEQAAPTGKVASIGISVPRLARTGEYCSSAKECKSKACVRNRCCGSARLQCRGLDCASDQGKLCYIEDVPCTSRTDCPVNPICDTSNPCRFSKCAEGYHCQLSRSCILPPSARCVKTESPKALR